MVPSLESALVGFEGSARESLFGFLLTIDREERQRSKDEIPDDDYILRFPEYEEQIRKHAVEDASGDDASTTEAMGGFGELKSSVEGRNGPPLGSSVGSFQIQRLIGEGGMGQVYEAEQQNPKRRVALKLVSPQARTARLAQRFQLEAEVLARLHHPGIAAIFECGEHGGEYVPQPYFAMEYVDGVDIRTFAERANLSINAKLSLLAEVADAIEHAHTKGVIHRDLKPDNVLVREDGRPKVLDFGIARVTDNSTLMRTAVTETGELIGTLNYMAPEQLSGDSKRINEQTDVYALGVILFELLAGQRPQEISGLSLTAAIRKIADEEAPRIGRFVNGIERDVETIIGKALQKEPHRRYASAGALASDLRRFLAREPITARAPSAIYLARRFSQRHRGLVLGVTVAFVAITLGLVAAWSSSIQEARAREKAERMGIDALASSYLATHATLERGDPWAARDQLDRIDPEYRGWEWRWLNARAPLLLEGLHPWHIAIQGHHVGALVLGEGKSFRPMVIVDLMHPERRSVVTELDEGAFAPINPGGGPALVQTRIPRPAEITPTGYLAATAVVDLPTGQIVELIEHDSPSREKDLNGVHARSRSNDGTIAVIYKAWSNGQHSSFQVSSREERKAGQPFRQSPGYRGWIKPDLSADGKVALVTSTFKNLGRVVSTRDFSDIAILDLDVNMACSMDRRGERVARLRDGGLLEILDIPTLDVLRRFELPRGKSNALHWIREDRWLWAQVGNSHYILDAEGGEILQTIANGTSHGYSGLNENGRFIALHGGRRNLPWIVETDAPPASAYRELEGHTSYIYQVAVSPDGSLIASSSPVDPELRLWDGWTGELLATLPRAISNRGSRNFDAPLAFSDDGRNLLTTAKTDDGGVVVSYDLATGTSTSYDQDGPADHYAAVRAVLGDLAGRRLSGSIVGHPDGRRVFRSIPSRDHNHPLRIQDSVSGESPRLGVAQGIGLSPDGELLAVGERGGVRLLRTSNLQEVATYEIGGPLARYYAVAWSPDGKRLALGEDQGHITILETKYFRPTIDLPDHDSYVFSMVWSPDGTRLVTASGDATLRIHDTVHGIPSRLRVEDRAQRAQNELTKLDALVIELGSIPDAVDSLLQEAGDTGGGDDEATAMAARRACLLRWVRERANDGG